MGLTDLVDEEQKKKIASTKNRTEVPDIDCDDEEFLNWLGGFFDGEGSVSFYISKDNTSRLGYRANLMVRMSQHNSNGEKEKFHTIVDKLGIGRVSTEESSSKGEFCRLRMGSMQDSIAFLRIIEEYCIIKEDEIDHALDIAERMADGEHLYKEGLVRIAKDIQQFIKDNRTETQSERELKHGPDVIKREANP